MWRRIHGMFHWRRRNVLAFLFLFSAGLFFLHFHFYLCVVTMIPREEFRNLATRSRRDEEKTLTRRESRTYGNEMTISDSNIERERNKRKDSPCRKTQEESRFREIERGMIAYSAWYDNRKSQHIVRILLLASTREPLPSLFCRFEGESKQFTFTSSVSYYQHNENHYMRFGCYIASCVVPPELNRIPCFVNVSARSTSKTQNGSNSLVLPVRSIDRQRSIEKVSHKQYGICIPPLHGEISVDRLIEFLELSQLLGTSHFTFYNLEVSDSVQNVLDYYEDKGVVRVLPWNLPPYIGKYDIHYFGQILSIMDCLFRSMSDLDFVAFNDLDEFIVPLYHDNMSVLLEDIHREEHCGHCFQSVIFDPFWEDVQMSRLFTQRVFHRTKEITPFWTKCIVDPCRIFEQGIHHISKPIEDDYIVDKVDWRRARVFHYRKCDDSQALMQPTCSGNIEEDKTMKKYEERLQVNFEMNTMAIADFAETDPESF